MLQKITKTRPGYDLAILRVTLGVVLLAHGSQKMLGWFGGYGFTGTINAFSQYMHIAAPITVMVIFIEFFGSLMLITGLFTRVAALGVFGLFTGIFIMASGHSSGFFMNWEGAAKPEGFEYFLLILGMALTLLIAGGGALSIDKSFSKNSN